MNTDNYIPPTYRFRKILASARKMMLGSNRPEAYKELYERTGSVYR